jgi:ankyrin repeat protein
MRETISYIQRFTTRSRVNKFGLTPIYAAVLNGDEETVRHVLNTCGTDSINIPCEADFTPLAIAIMQSNKPVFKLLLNYGANVFQRQSKGRYSYLHRCASQFGLDVYFAQELLARGLGQASAEELLMIDSAPAVLYSAITHGNYELAKLLIRKGKGHSVNQAVSRKSDETVFCRILSDGPDMACLNFLLELTGRDEPDFCINKTSQASVLHRLSSSLNNPLGAMLTKQVYTRVLQKFGSRDKLDYKPVIRWEGRRVAITALHVAVWYGNVEAVLALVKAGANIDERTGEGQSVYQLAEMKVAPEGIPDELYGEGEESVDRWRKQMATIETILRREENRRRGNEEPGNGKRLLHESMGLSRNFSHGISCCDSADRSLSTKNRGEDVLDNDRE